MTNFSVSTQFRTNYDGYYEGESEWRRLCANDKAANIVELCGATPHTKVLDIGSGEGAVLQRLADLAFARELYSLEISETSVEVIGRRGIKNLVECRIFDGYNVPYAAMSFDLAILSHVVEHVEHPRKLLYEAGRVARYVFVEVPLELNLRLSRDWQWNSVGHINFYTPKSIRVFLQTCGFTIISQKVTNPSYIVYRYQYGYIKAMLHYAVKELTLRLRSDLATAILTYHCSLLCHSLEPGSLGQYRGESLSAYG